MSPSVLFDVLGLQSSISSPSGTRCCSAQMLDSGHVVVFSYIPGPVCKNWLD